MAGYRVGKCKLQISFKSEFRTRRQSDFWKLQTPELMDTGEGVKAEFAVLILHNKLAFDAEISLA